MRWLILLLIAAPLVSALGVSPAGSTIEYVAGEDRDLALAIANSERQDFIIGLSAQGELKDIVSFPVNPVEVSKADYMTPFVVRFNFPQDLEPGIHVVKVKMTPDFSDRQGTVAAFVSPEADIKVWSPYPDKYAKINTVFLQDLGFVESFVEFDNLGDLDIADARAKIRLAGGVEKVLLSEGISIPRGSLGKVRVGLKLALEKGYYTAYTEAVYDGLTATQTTTLLVGKPGFIVSEFEPKLVAGEISRVRFVISSDWNTELVGTPYLEIDNTSTELPRVSIQSRTPLEVDGFFDARSFEPSAKKLTLRLEGEGYSYSEDFDVEIKSKMESLARSLIVPAVLILIVALAVLAYVWMRKKTR